LSRDDSFDGCSGFGEAALRGFDLLGLELEQNGPATGGKERKQE
jgi:hypothetical protein